MKDSIMSFKICGKHYELSEYNQAIEENFETRNEFFPILIELPYTMRSIKSNQIEKIKNLPIYIVYKKRQISLFDLYKNNNEFLDTLPLVSGINGLEVKYEMNVIFTHIKEKNDYHAVIFETFRILQDLEFMMATARWALVQAHKILHFRSGLVWKNGWEQLWTRAIWLNNAIVLYDSCFDKILQSVWIGNEGYNAKQNLNRTSLYSIESLDSLYRSCWHKDSLGKISNPYREPIETFFSSEISKKVSNYAQSIKHRGGMRYLDLFPYGQIFEETDKQSYCSFNTRNLVDIDEVVDLLKDYHIMLCELTTKIHNLLMEEFKYNGYLSKENIII